VYPTTLLFGSFGAETCPFFDLSILPILRVE
jgi:hypothetical protein